MDNAHNVFSLLKDRLASLHYPYTRSKTAYGSVNVNGQTSSIINMCFTASLYPNLGNVEYDERIEKRVVRPRFDELVYPVLSAVREEHFKLDTFITYSEKSISGQGTTIKNAAMISAISVVLACDQFQNNIDDAGVLKIGPWKIQIDPTAVSIISAVRSRFDALIHDVLSNNETFNITHEQGREIASFVVDMIEM